MKKREMVLILSSIFIIAVVWIIFNVYHNSVTSTISEALGIRILPINPNFDTQTIEKLKKRKQVPPVVESRISGKLATESAITPTIPPIPSPSIISPSPTIPLLISPTAIPGTQSGGLLP